MQQDDEAGLPVRAALHPTGLYLAVRQIDRRELQDAFMQETIARVPSQERIVHITSDRVGVVPEDAAPAGIVFHVARCGSTLISQSLRQLDTVTVYSEPQPINEILAPPHKWGRAERVAALRSLGAAFARHARGPYVLKLSSWNTLYCDVVAEAFPSAPWVLSLRDPVEVGVSLLASPPGWFSGTTDAARGLAAEVDPEGVSASREEFVARAYGAFCAAAAKLDTTRGRLIHYKDLPAAIWTMVAPHFALAINSSDSDRMATMARRHAKAAVGSASEFKSDASAKQEAASPALRRAIDLFARPQLERLTQLHAATITP